MCDYHTTLLYSKHNGQPENHRTSTRIQISVEEKSKYAIRNF